MRMNVQGWLGADNPLSKYRWPKEDATDDIKLLDNPPGKVPSKAHCKFYYLVSLSVPFHLPAHAPSQEGKTVHNLVVQLDIKDSRMQLSKVRAHIMKKFTIMSKEFKPSYDIGVFNEDLGLYWSDWDRTAPVTCGWVYIRDRECTYIEIDLTENS